MATNGHNYFGNLSYDVSYDFPMVCRAGVTELVAGKEVAELVDILHIIFSISENCDLMFILF